MNSGISRARLCIVFIHDSRGTSQAFCISVKPNIMHHDPGLRCRLVAVLPRSPQPVGLQDVRLLFSVKSNPLKNILQNLPIQNGTVWSSDGYRLNFSETKSLETQMTLSLRRQVPIASQPAGSQAVQVLVSLKYKDPSSCAM